MLERLANLVVVAVTAPDGCVTNYSVSGNVATAAAGQVCNTTTEAGVAETITVISHTLTPPRTACP
ncbi:MAG TPA: hypothetical protein VMI75_18335 [Polyangiaceae bacterium]|nr:hypothetical protein [Polyangiaceae bacterium]